VSFLDLHTTCLLLKGFDHLLPRHVMLVSCKLENIGSIARNEAAVVWQLVKVML
jgi:hypothetical protein